MDEDMCALCGRDSELYTYIELHMARLAFQNKEVKKTKRKKERKGTLCVRMRLDYVLRRYLLVSIQGSICNKIKRASTLAPHDRNRINQHF